MKSAVYLGNRTFASGPSQRVAPAPGDVRLNVAYCGVCGTDIHIYHGAMDQRVGPPQIIGHEASAEIAEIGEGVEDFAVGRSTGSASTSSPASHRLASLRGTDGTGRDRPERGVPPALSAGSHVLETRHLRLPRLSRLPR